MPNKNPFDSLKDEKCNKQDCVYYPHDYECGPCIHNPINKHITNHYVPKESTKGWSKNG